jgi:fluoride exporter
MLRLLLICLGGAVGTAARYGIATWCRAALGPDFPFGTMAVNVLGSFLLGVVLHVGLNSEMLSVTARLALGTGVMGGFTTYSSFNYETIQLFQDRAYKLGALNLLGTVVGCALAGLLGIAAGRAIVSAAR